jgi:Phage integrase family
MLHGLDGRAMYRQRFVTKWRKTADAADLPMARFHDLRHAFASRLINAACSVKTVQAALGHERASTTLDTYGHLWPGDDDRERAGWTAHAGRVTPESRRPSGLSGTADQGKIQASGTQLPWKPKGTRCGNWTRATGSPVKSCEARMTRSLPSRSGSYTTAST